MPLKTSSGMYGWDEIRINNGKILGEIVISMFPSYLAGYSASLGSKLKDRWQKYGILYVGGTHSLIASKRFGINLPKTEIP